VTLLEYNPLLSQASERQANTNVHTLLTTFES